MNATIDFIIEHVLCLPNVVSTHTHTPVQRITIADVLHNMANPWYVEQPMPIQCDEWVPPTQEEILIQRMYTESYSYNDTLTFHI